MQIRLCLYTYTCIFIFVFYITECVIPWIIMNKNFASVKKCEIKYDNHYQMAKLTKVILV